MFETLGCMTNIVSGNPNGVFYGIDHFFSARVDYPVSDVSFLNVEWPKKIGHWYLGVWVESGGVQFANNSPSARGPGEAKGGVNPSLSPRRETGV